MGREIPAHTGLPLLFDDPWSSTLDLHIASTDFTKCLNDYVNEISAFYYFNSTKYEADPVYAQAKFFAQLNDSKLNLRDSYVSSFDENSYVRSDVGYRLSKLDTLLKPEETWIVDKNGLPERRTTGGLLSAYHAINLETEKTRWVELEEDVDAIVKQKTENLKNDFGMKNMNEEFMLYWKEKFDKTHSAVKEQYYEFVKNPRFDYFTSTSDSVGVLARIKESIDSFTVPLADIKLDSTIPSLIHPVASDKLDEHTKTAALELSKRTNIMFRQNLIHIKGLAYMEAQNTNDIGAHGTYLVSDYSHRDRISEIAADLMGHAGDAIGSSFSILTQIMIAQNEQKFVPPKVQMVVENSMYQVTTLKNRIEQVTKDITNDQILKAESGDITDLD